MEEKLKTDEKVNHLAGQGFRLITANHIQVLDEAAKEVPWDGSTSGEIVLLGNTLFSDYYRNQEATSEAFRNDGFHTGEIAVVHPNGDFEIRDRMKDVIISGGETFEVLR